MRVETKMATERRVETKMVKRICWVDRNYLCEIYGENECEPDCPIKMREKVEKRENSLKT